MFYYFIEQTGDQNEAVETPLLEGYLHKCYIYMLYNDFLEVITTKSKKIILYTIFIQAQHYINMEYFKFFLSEIIN